MINNTNKNPYKNEKDMADSTTQLYHINLFILCNYLKKTCFLWRFMRKWIPVSQELQKIRNPRVMYFFFHAVVATFIAHMNT